MRDDLYGVLLGDLAALVAKFGCKTPATGKSDVLAAGRSACALWVRECSAWLAARQPRLAARILAPEMVGLVGPTLPPVLASHLYPPTRLELSFELAPALLRIFAARAC